MIRHICMFKIKEENKEKNLADLLEKVQSLRAISEIKRFDVVLNVEGTPETNYDVSLIFDFDTIADLETYQKNEIHVNFGKFVSAMREARACIDYEM
ncbi:MAG: Dabb family protein [Ruminococcaceae bacterium]|nr:Dabb family protein [Oscillospiraceae bacterium]